MTLTKSYHSQKWRVCPVCGIKLKHHVESEEYWLTGRGKQLVHKKRCSRKYRDYLKAEDIPYESFHS